MSAIPVAPGSTRAVTVRLSVALTAMLVRVHSTWRALTVQVQPLPLAPIASSAADNAPSKSTAVAGSGPMLPTAISKLTFCPVSTDAGTALPLMPRSARSGGGGGGSVVIEVLSVSALLALFESGSLALTVARLFNVVACDGAVTSIDTLELAPAASTPVKVQLIVLLPLQVQPGPVAAINVTPAGSTSSTRTPVASPAPRLLTASR